MNNMAVLDQYPQHPHVNVGSVDVDPVQNETNRPFVDDEMYQQFQQTNPFM